MQHSSKATKSHSEKYRKKKKQETFIIETSVKDLETRNQILKLKIKKLTSLIETYTVFYNKLKSALESSQIENVPQLIAEQAHNTDSKQVNCDNNIINKTTVYEQANFNVPLLLFSEKSPVQVNNQESDDLNGFLDFNSDLILGINYDLFSNDFSFDDFNIFNSNIEIN